MFDEKSLIASVTKEKISKFGQSQTEIQTIKTVKITHVSSDKQLADVFTKPLASNIFTRFRSELGLI